MKRRNHLKAIFLASAAAAILAGGAMAQDFSIPGGDLETALNRYMIQTGVALTVSDSAIKGIHSNGASGNLSSDEALSKILTGTGFVTRRRVLRKAVRGRIRQIAGLAVAHDRDHAFIGPGHEAGSGQQARQSGTGGKIAFHALRLHALDGIAGHDDGGSALRHIDVQRRAEIAAGNIETGREGAGHQACGTQQPGK
jgi:hypothetical protein